MTDNPRSSLGAPYLSVWPPTAWLREQSWFRRFPCKLKNRVSRTVLKYDVFLASVFVSKDKQVLLMKRKLRKWDFIQYPIEHINIKNICNCKKNNTYSTTYWLWSQSTATAYLRIRVLGIRVSRGLTGIQALPVHVLRSDRQVESVSVAVAWCLWDSQINV
jgi:hypothetical protein